MPLNRQLVFGETWQEECYVCVSVCFCECVCSRKPVCIHFIPVLACQTEPGIFVKVMKRRSRFTERQGRRRRIEEEFCQFFFSSVLSAFWQILQLTWACLALQSNSPLASNCWHCCPSTWQDPFLAVETLLLPPCTSSPSPPAAPHIDKQLNTRMTENKQQKQSKKHKDELTFNCFIQYSLSVCFVWPPNNLTSAILPYNSRIPHDFVFKYQVWRWGCSPLMMAWKTGEINYQLPLLIMLFTYALIFVILLSDTKRFRAFSMCITNV